LWLGYLQNIPCLSYWTKASHTISSSHAISLGRPGYPGWRGKPGRCIFGHCYDPSYPSEPGAAGYDGKPGKPGQLGKAGDDVYIQKP